ncbi:fibroblast growth factor receptor 4 [Biomphalaria glabrata]
MMRLVGSVITSATLVHCLWGPQQPPMSDPMGSAPPCCHYRLRTDTIGECVTWKCSYSQQQPNMIPRSNLTDCNCIVETGTREPSPDVMKDSPGFEPSPCRAELPVQPCDCPPGAHPIPPFQKSDMEPKPPDWSTETSPAQSTATSLKTAPTDDSSIKTNASSIATRSRAVEPVTEPITNTAKPSNKILPEFLVNPENKPPFDANQTLEALKTREDNFKKTSSDSGAMTIGVLVAVIGAIIGLVIVIIIRQRKKIKIKYKQDKKGSVPARQPFGPAYGNSVTKLCRSDLLQKSSSQLEEIPRKDIRFLNTLGKGMFGTVVKAEVYNLRHRGILKTAGEWTTVAVKMTLVSGHQNEEVKADFLAELYLMKSLPPHRNVVAMYGSCTGQDPYLMLMEFAVQGDLKSHLMNLRERGENDSQETVVYTIHLDSSKDTQRISSEALSSKMMFSFALQIARGLEHLATNKVVHRDVAARNILLFERNVVKISDFGLARRVGQCDVYERTRKGLLPVRWMSPETLLCNQFSEKSDVWSFGVLLWEMVTLGSTPYSEFDFDQVVEQIKGRQLLTCPYNAEGMISALMMTCWQSSADDRPTFSKLCKQIERLLEENSDYIDLDVPDDHEYSTVT